MDASENTIQPSRGAERAAVPTVFAGTVTGVRKESGEQTLEVRFSQGKIQVKAEGDFQAGEKVRLSFSGQGSVQIEKASGDMAEAEAGDGVGYTLPRNMGALKDLRAFEENLVRWMSAGGGEPGGPWAGAVPGGTAGAQSGGAAAQGALMRLTLPQLMLQALERPGGGAVLAQSLAALDPGMISALMDALEAAPGDAAGKARLLELLKNVVKSPAAVPADPERMGAGNGPALRPGETLVHAPVRAAVAGNADAFLPAESGAGHAPWFGRILERREADDSLSPSQRLRLGGTGGPSRNEPMFRYLMDMGGRNMEVFSSQAREPGAFTDFRLERHGGRLEARFSDPAASLPAGLRTAMAGASGEVRQGMLLASHYLQEFRDEPYYGQLAEDFGEVLAQSGRLDPPAADGKAAAIPDRRELDGLLKLFVAFPRDAARPEPQARAWGDAVKDPQAMMQLLRSLRPEEEASLLRARTALRVAGESAAGAPDKALATEALLNAAVRDGDSPEQVASLLRKILPESFRSEDLWNLAKDISDPGKSGGEHEAARFLLQSVSHGFPREDQIREGRPTQFYFYQGQEWRNLQVTWERSGGNGGRGKSGPKAPLQVKVETHSRHMGKVNVAVSWEPKGARLEFRNQIRDVRELLAQSLPELERSLALMDFRVASWSYQLLPEDSAASMPDPGWTRPASLSDGNNLDLMG